MQISKYQIYMTALVAAIVIICFGIVLYGTRNVKKEINQEETETVIESETCASQQVKTSGPECTEQFRLDVSKDNIHPYDVACERKLTEDDLAGMSKKELRLMRNWIFARHGYIFSTTEMRNYFEQQPWYQGRYSNVTSMLTDIEKYNINFIKEHE
jgi:hypothetical protein